MKINSSDSQNLNRKSRSSIL
uniref:Uncharacterized protein n=1 Tax=Rhizophora mucronata TaxID=61149 RepID=A0A2P2IK90_RHIMU